MPVYRHQYRHSRLPRLARLTGGLALALAALRLPALFSAEPAGAAIPPTPLVWPAAPAEARIAFVKSISGPADFGVRLSFWGRIVNFFTGANRGAEKLVKPTGIAVDEAGDLCVTDTGAAAVCFFDSRRKSYRRWEKIGKIRFISPVAVAKRGETLFVADPGLKEILAFDVSGRLLFEITQSIEHPAGLAIYGEQLYMADAHAHCVMVFDLRGHFAFTFGERGAGPGEFNFPTHVAADASGHIFVTDSMNNRVEVFDAKGRFQSVIGSVGDGSGRFSRPKGVAADSFGHVYVADALFDNFQIFDLAGRFLLDVGSTGQKAGEFWMPAGIAISRDNRIFVADSYNHRVQVFRYLGGS